MYPLDFEEFLYANGMNSDAIRYMQDKFRKEEILDEAAHAKIMDLFRNQKWFLLLLCIAFM